MEGRALADGMTTPGVGPRSRCGHHARTARVLHQGRDGACLDSAWWLRARKSFGNASLTSSSRRSTSTQSSARCWVAVIVPWLALLVAQTGSRRSRWTVGRRVNVILTIQRTNIPASINPIAKTKSRQHASRLEKIRSDLAGRPVYPLRGHSVRL